MEAHRYHPSQEGFKSRNDWRTYSYIWATKLDFEDELERDPANWQIELDLRSTTARLYELRRERFANLLADGMPADIARQMIDSSRDDEVALFAPHAWTPH